MVIETELLPALKVFLGYGATGALAVIMTIFWVRERREIKKSNENRIEAEKLHQKDMMRLQSEHAKELVALIRQCDQTISMVNTTLDKLLARED